MDIRTRLRRPLVVVCAAGVALTLAACSSSSGGSSAAAGSGGGGGGAASTQAAAQSGSGGGNGKLDVCTLVPASKVASVTGHKYTKGDPAEATTSGWTSGCGYDNDDSTIDPVQVNVSNQNATQTWGMLDTGSVTAVSGLGDKAIWDNDGSLYVLKGSVLIQVNGLDSKDQSIALAQPVLSALG